MDPGIFDFGGEGGQTLVQIGSRINTDRFPKKVPKAQASWGIRGYASRGNQF